MKNSKISHCCVALIGEIEPEIATILSSLCRTSINTCSNQNTDLDFKIYHANEVPLTLIEPPVIDTEEEDNAKNDFALYHALTSTRLNGILIVLKYEPRHFKIIRQFKEYSEKLSDIDSTHFVVIITRWDNTKHQLNERESIIRSFEKEGVPASRIFFSSHQDHLAVSLYTCFKDTEKFKAKLSKEDFVPPFKMKTIKNEGRALIQEFKNNTSKLFESYKDPVLWDQLSQSSTVREKWEQLNSLGEKFHRELQQKLKDLEVKYKSTIKEWFYVHILLLKRLSKLYDRYMEFLESLAVGQETEAVEHKIEYDQKRAETKTYSTKVEDEESDRGEKVWKEKKTSQSKKKKWNCHLLDWLSLPCGCR